MSQDLFFDAPVDRIIDTSRRRETWSFKMGGSHYTRYSGKNAHDNAQRSQAAHVGGLVGYRSFLNFWYVPYFRVMPNEDRESLSVIGTDVIDGRSCCVVEIRQSYFWSEQYRNKWRLYVDLSRNGLVMRREWHHNEQVMDRVDIHGVAEIADSRGVKHWFPSKAVRKYFVQDDAANDPKMKIGEKATYETRYVVLLETVRINTGLKCSDIEISPDSKIVDLSKVKVLPPGSNENKIRRTDVTVDDVMRVIKQANDQNVDLLAKGNVREKGLVDRLTLYIAAVGVVGLLVGVVLRLRRNRQR